MSCKRHLGMLPTLECLSLWMYRGLCVDHTPWCCCTTLKRPRMPFSPNLIQVPSYRKLKWQLGTQCQLLIIRFTQIPSYHGRWTPTCKYTARTCAAAHSARLGLCRPGPAPRVSCSRRDRASGTPAPPAECGCSCRPSGCLSAHCCRAQSSPLHPSCFFCCTYRLQSSLSTHHLSWLEMWRHNCFSTYFTESTCMWWF